METEREVHMRESVIRQIESHFQSYEDFVETLQPDDLKPKLDVIKHKSVMEHLWCIVGSRESYAKAIVEDRWQGFSCSMKKYDHADFVTALRSSGEEIQASINGVSEWTLTRDKLLLELLEHEVMHEGQIIRHMYGLEKKLPQSWRWA